MFTVVTMGKTLKMLGACVWITICFSLHSHCFLIDENITVGILMQPPSASRLDIRSFKPPLDIAIETVKELVQRKEYVFFDISCIYRFSETNCRGPSAMRAPGKMAELFYSHEIQCIFGPLCSPLAVGVADLAAFWNIPVLSGSTTADYLDDKSRYQTLTRLAFKQSTLAKFVARICEEFGWNAATVLAQSTLGYWSFVAPAISGYLSEQSVRLNDVLWTDYESTGDALRAAISRGRSKLISLALSRFCLVSCSAGLKTLLNDTSL